MFVRGPQHFYVIPYDDDGLEIAKCLWVDEMCGTDIAVRFGLKKYESDTNYYDVIQYIDEHQMSVIVNDKDEAFSIENVLGFVPVVCIGNIGVPGSPFGDTDVEPGIPLAEEITYRVSLEDEAHRHITTKYQVSVPEADLVAEIGAILDRHGLR